ILRTVERNGQPFGVQLMVSALRWRLGDGVPPPPDPVRGKSLHLRREDETRREANAYFETLYQQALGGNDTQQVSDEVKERSERLPASPTLNASAGDAV